MPARNLKRKPKYGKVVKVGENEFVQYNEGHPFRFIQDHFLDLTPTQMAQVLRKRKDYVTKAMMIMRRRGDIPRRSEMTEKEFLRRPNYPEDSLEWFIERNFFIMSVKDIAKSKGKTINQVKYAIDKMQKKGIIPSKREIVAEYLAKSAKKRTVKQMATTLHVNRAELYKKLKEQGIQYKSGKTGRPRKIR